MMNIQYQVPNTQYPKSNSGFTLVELLVIVTILTILTTMSISALFSFRKESYLSSGTEEIINILRLAQNKTLASEGAGQYGVYFEDSTTPHQYILFKGTDFASRDNSFDQVKKLSESIEIYEINLNGSKEVVFNQITGETYQSGNISLRLKSDTSKNKTIYIENSGQISLISSSLPTNGRVKDSRHVHIDYIQVIDTVTDKLILTLDTTVIEEIIISDNIKDDQIYWEGEIDVGGDIQILKIHTHRLNNPDTQFCIHRDRRYNNKALYIDLSGAGGIIQNLINFNSDGQTNKGSSIFVLEPQWQ